MAEQQIPDLPNDIWEQIITNLNSYKHHESPSVTSTRFFTLTNRLRTSLTITDQTFPHLSSLLNRFTNLKSINASQFYGDLDLLIHHLTQSGLNLNIVELNISNQKSIPLNINHCSNLKILKCAKLCCLRDSDFVTVAKALPLLEELDISYPANDYNLSFVVKASKGNVTDAGIEVLATNLKHLTKIDLSGNQFISDKALMVLSMQCISLREVYARDCCFVSQVGIGFLMRNCVNLSNVSVYGVEMIPYSDYSRSSCFVIRDSVAKMSVLRSVDFSYSTLSDDFLSVFANACVPLQKLVLSHCYNFTYFGLSSVLGAYSSLTHLSLISVDFLTDKNVAEFSKSLRNLSYLSLNLCSKLSNSTLFTVAKNCRFLKHVEMERTSLGIEEFHVDFAVNTSMTTLKVARNAHLTDAFVRKIVLVCPNLQVVDVRYCASTSLQGIITLLNGCNDIQDLSFNQCGGELTNTEMSFQQSKLEILRAEGSGVDDNWLALMGNKCPRLVHLDLEGCLNVTIKGVNEVLKNCRVLKELNLRKCDTVGSDCVAWIVFSSRTLRKLILPSKYVLTENQRNLFLDHGCLVCNS